MRPRKKSLFFLTVYGLLNTGYAVHASPKLAPAHLEGQVVEDLAAPFNLQAVTLNQTVNLNWAWEPPDPGPAFQYFGYEVSRDSEVVAIVPTTAYTDFKTPIGTHSYQVRVKGSSIDLKKKAAHYSAWSEPAGIEIHLTCSGPPVIRLTVEPTKKEYGAIHALRLHFKGDVKVPNGCKAEKLTFHIDSGLSTERTGPLSMDSQGRFDEFVDAMGGEEEQITGAARFDITVSAKDEVGGTTSSVFTIDLQQENRFAPKQQPHY